MKKRNKIMIVTVSILLVVVLLFVGFDGSFLNQKYASVWSAKYIEEQDTIQSKLIAYGIRAASSHNTQPWFVKTIDDATIELYADMEKALPVVDGDKKQLLMSQGTFIESYKQGALFYNYSVNVTYHEVDITEDRPLIATLHIQQDTELHGEDSTSGSTYDSLNADNGDLRVTIDECISDYPGFKYTLVDTESDVEKLEGMLLEGTIIESKDKKATQELLNVFRWTEWDKNKYRYGLSLNTLPTHIRPFVQPLMKILSKDLDSFGESGIKQFKERLEKQTKYILIHRDNPVTLDYVASGQIYQQLVHEVSGYDLRPAMQVLENFDAMKNLNMQFQAEYGKNGDVVWVIGLQEKSDILTNSNPRLLVEDIMIQ